MIEEIIHPWKLADSSWVTSYAYGVADGWEVLLVEFRDGAVCAYPDLNEDFYFRMDAAPSKGRFVWDNLYHRPYFLP